MKIYSKTSLLTLLLIVPCILFSQFEAQKWYFGYNAGLNFATSPPTVLNNGAMRTDEGSASISDATGNLLFYTDGITVYNQAHAIMANGTGLMGNGSSTQSSIIVKKPGSQTTYYVFTLEQTAGVNGFRYSEVDLTLAAGMGSVTVKNYSLYTPSCEKMTAIAHCNGSDIWVVTHEWNSANFKSYLVTAAGVSLTPIVSASGAAVNGANGRTIGQMKVSPNGKKLGLTIYDGSAGPVEMHDFDALTGMVSNGFMLHSATSNYGCEFSPDGTKFYSGRVTVPELFQWDLCAGSNTAIIASRVTMTTTNDYTGSFQLATDGKIYIARMFVPFLSLISSPNNAGASCNFTNTGLSLGQDTSTLGLPNFINSFFKQPSTPFTFTASCQNVDFSPPAPQGTVASGCSFATNPVVSYAWDFGDLNSSFNNTSTLANPSHTFSAGGTYTVKLALNYSCSTDTVRVPLTVSALSFTFSGFSTVCAKDVRTYTAAGASSYSWSTGATTPTITLTTTVTTTYTVTAYGMGPNPCKVVQPFKITVAKCTGIESDDASDTFFKVYPNPTNGNLTIETDKDVKVIITNALGQVVLERSYNAGSHNAEIHSFKEGIYFVKSTSGSSSKITRLVKTE
ncbi:hypothetical protein CNR22_17045 [Sphingobacteriaceae bacterium]|nr:hypothetical protein CNR22_17045 [Sphingobacteriaceae bacterium]